MAAAVSENGDVSALCLAKPRAISSKRASWTNRQMREIKGYFTSDVIRSVLEAALRATIAQQAAEIEQLTRERDEARENSNKAVWAAQQAQASSLSKTQIAQEALDCAQKCETERDTAQAALSQALEASNKLQADLTAARRETADAWVKCQTIVTAARASLPKTAEAQGAITTIINGLFDAAMGCDTKEKKHEYRHVALCGACLADGSCNGECKGDDNAAE